MGKVVGNSAYIENEFVHVNSRECTLVVEFNEEGFSFSILHINSNEVLYSGVSSSFLDFFNSDEKQIKEIFKQENIFKYAFNNVIILIDNFYTTVVPFGFYDENKLKEFLAFNTKLPNAKIELLSDKIPSIDYFNIYVNSSNLKKVLDSHFTEIELISTKSVILYYAKKVAFKEEFLQVHIGLKSIYCVFMNEEKLIYSNSFKFDNPEDIIFNVLNIYNQLGLNNERTTITLSGNISKNDKTYELLYMYIKNIHFVSKPKKLNYSHRVKFLASQYYMHHYVAFL